MSKTSGRQFRLALIGTNSLCAQEIKGRLASSLLPLKSIEFYDPGVEEEYSQLTEFKGEAKVIHHPDAYMLEGLDLVFLAADRKTNIKFGRLAREKGFRAIDLAGSFMTDPEVPAVVTGVNDKILDSKQITLVANPHPISIILSQVFSIISGWAAVRKFLAVALQPVSAFDQAGIEELAEESFALLSGESYERKIFADQIAFNLLPLSGKKGSDGYTLEEKQIEQEMKGILAGKNLAFSLSVVQVPVFHGYGLMIHAELAESKDPAELESVFKKNRLIKFFPSGSSQPVSNKLVAGEDDIFAGHLKLDPGQPGGFWLWVAADNLTAGSANNALGLAKKMLGLK
ncbi:MAG: Asd/ArgC dimerization domain-containing protein [Acidobacteriota bacterium]|nr:Asd/ArgC dimerization domain-containing protein [Acidobacteriota bacterium]